MGYYPFYQSLFVLLAPSILTPFEQILLGSRTTSSWRKMSYESSRSYDSRIVGT
jgi:hypothetical protein